MKKNNSKTAPKIEPLGAPVIIATRCQNCFYYLFEHTVFNLTNKNKCNIANQYLPHILRVFELKSFEKLVKTAPTKKLLSKFSLLAFTIHIIIC